MCKLRLASLLLSLSLLPASVAAQNAHTTPALAPASNGDAVLWSDPGDIASKNLLYGSGGEQGQPHPPVTFEKEDLKGTNPKFDVRDQDGSKWKVKLGVEAKPETVATRLLWAVGYVTDDDYFVRDLKVQNLPAQLKRGQNFVKNGNEFEDARLKRHPKHTESAGEWKWGKNPFSGTRELNGLRVMMALINNWDLKDENNAIYENKDNGQKLYAVSDLGASFGSIGYRLGSGRGKGDLGDYKHSKFVTQVHHGKVDFATPAHSTVVGLVGVFSVPNFVKRQELRWIGRDIPVADAKWIGSLLAQLKPEQIADAFRAGGYSDEAVREYTAVVQERIGELQKL